MDQKVWGWHLSINASFCDLASMQDYNNVYNFTKKLVDKIDMVAFGEPQIVFFGSDEKSGYTMTQLIETSNICAHFSDGLNAIFLDVFSCKPFENDVVIELVKEYFGSPLIEPIIETHFEERSCHF